MFSASIKKLAAPGVRSIVWDGDELVDGASGGVDHLPLVLDPARRRFAVHGAESLTVVELSS